MSDTKPIAVEMKFANYFKSKENDYVFAKVVEHYADGRKVPALRHFLNYERSFYVTREPYRVNKQKKEYEHIDKLKEYKCRQMDLVPAISKAIGYRGTFNGPLKHLCRNPYVYNVDINTPTIIMNDYRTKYPDAITQHSVAVLDIETNVHTERQDPIIVTVSFKDKAIVAIDKHWLGAENCNKEKLLASCMKYNGDLIESRKIDIEFYFGENAGDISAKAISRINEWMPDFVAIWKIEFDIKKILDALKYYGYNPNDIFSHPSVPKEFRNVSFYEDNKPQMKIVNGKETFKRKDQQDQWNFLTAPSASIYICGMRVYSKARVAAEGKSNDGYSLDVILKKHVNRKKVKIDGLDHLDGSLDYHRVAQKFNKLDYVAYGLGDCILVEVLEDEILDLPINIGNFIGISEYKYYFTQTKKASDEMHILHLKHGKPLCATSDQMKLDIDALTYGKGKEEDREGWIAMLASFKCHPTTREFFKGTGIPCLIRRDNADVDAKATYPTGEEVFNISQQTIVYEMVSVEGLTLSEQMMMGIDITGGKSNAAILLNTIYGMPPFQDVLDLFNADMDLV